nr:MAG: hypothetical protein [Sanya tombus-like virus 5]
MARNSRGPRTPVTGGTRRKRNTQPQSQTTGADSSIIRYSAIGQTMATAPSTSYCNMVRGYVPGLDANLETGTGPTIVGFYATGKFLPGTRIRWEPNVSFTTSGRIYVGFIDNPEVMSTILATSGTAFGAAVRGLGSVISFPVWQETDIPFPTKLRRKMFDTNSTPTTNVDQLDRSAQVYMFAYADGCPADTSLGSFWYHDVVAVEGIHAEST